MQIQDPVSSWHTPEAAYDAGDRQWFPCTEAFYYEMLEAPLNWTESRALGSCFAVCEAWKDGPEGRPLHLWFSARHGGYFCRVATCREIAQEIAAYAKP